MVKRSHGPQQKTRKKLTKKPRDKGKVSVVKQLQSFKEGDMVMIKVEPSVKGNVIHRRFMDKTATVIEKKGKAYRVRVKQLNKEKDLYVLPVHLVRL
ncbi:MAG: 50S ribosomal protein L21e [Nanoarchaeota archaeon]|nr:50S ribosomal protein L21e [Nanoarchaeota archaeon]